MTRQNKSEMISRRKALSTLAGAVGIPAAVLTASIADAQTPGMERREERREDRQDLRQERRDERQERRDERFGGDPEDRQGSKDQSQSAPATAGQAPQPATGQAPK